MKPGTEFLRSKVGRRIFVLFVLCALLPIAALAIVSFIQVTKQLREQSLARLQQANGAMVMSTLERLTLLETEMKMLAFTLPTGAKEASVASPKAASENLSQWFDALEIVTDDRRSIPVVGHIQNPPPLTSAQKQHMLSGKAVVSTVFRADGDARVFMSSALEPQNPMRGVLLAEINTAYLWSADAVPAQSELCVLDEAKRVLTCTAGIPASFRDSLVGEITSAPRGRFEWSHEGTEFLASYWVIPLRYNYSAPGWTVVVSESKADVFAPLAHFKTSFPLIVLLALWVVLLVSIALIRRSLVPLEKLREGTRRIAMRDFDSRVTITSNDEFQELATSFNAMAGRLRRQFNALATMSEIDRAVLSALEAEKIVDTVLAHLPDLLPCDFASVTLLDPEVAGTVRTYVPRLRTGEKWWRSPISPEELQKLRDNQESLLINVGEKFPNYLAPLTLFGVRSILLFPIFLDQGLSGIMNVGYRAAPQYSQDDLTQARRIANQVAIALSNARMIEKLKEFGWGTLTALARAIDAKSPWTSGHSERVTELACKLATEMDYTGADLDRVRRGGLLHDIGKIGTPVDILDKPGSLTADELRIMREHPQLGAHILQPIPGFEEILPIVLQHHEWMDGSGYPEGLVGEAISLDARIFAVADCYDALASDRPYRAGLPRAQVIEKIKEESGRHFDPRVVEAFLGLLKKEEKKESESAMNTAAEPSAPGLGASGHGDREVA
jgi:putative nucleotidyltransferase with HDIG domain